MSVEPMAAVVVGLDASDASLAALYLAGDEAAARVAPLVVVHAYAPAGAAPGSLPHVRQRLAGAVDRARTEHPGLAVSAVLVRGEPVEVLRQQADRASLLVLGQRTAAELRAGAPRSSVASRVAATAAAPVLVCRPFDSVAHRTAMPRPVVVGVDDLDSGEAAVAFGFEEAALRGAPLEVWHVPSRPAPREPGPLPGELSCGQDGVQVVLAEAVSGWSVRYPEVAVCQTVAHGPNVIRSLLDASHHAQLLVIGRDRRPSHAGPLGPVGRALVGRGGLLGPTGQALIGRAGCPVAVAGN